MNKIRTEVGDPVRAAELAALRPWIEFATAIVAIFAPPPNDGISEGDWYDRQAAEEAWTAQAVAQAADLTPYAVVDNHLPLMRRQSQRRVSNLDTRTSPGRRTLELVAQLERDLHAYQARGRTRIVTDGAS